MSHNQTYDNCKYFHTEICSHKDHELMQHAVIFEKAERSKVIFKNGQKSDEINNELCKNCSSFEPFFK